MFLSIRLLSKFSTKVDLFSFQDEPVQIFTKKLHGIPSLRVKAHYVLMKSLLQITFHHTNYILKDLQFLGLGIFYFCLYGLHVPPLCTCPNLLYLYDVDFN